MHLHFLGICGTFMGSLALLAKAQGHRVTGSDANVYPPMSTQLEEQGIELIEGYDPAQLDPAPDLVIIGNAMSRGNPAVEYVLDRGLAYASGPQWLRDHVLQGRWVIAVAGTHGKTTTSSMVAWILEWAGLEPGYLIGGIPQNFKVSARLGQDPFFVIEADEYDSAFFDKRSKFVHYLPRTLILNNLEYDHADIFEDIKAIQKQFHHVVRTVPGNGLVIHPQADPYLTEVLAMGCWTPVQRIGEGGWQADLLQADGSCFEVSFQGQRFGTLTWSLTGLHNVNNALAAIAAARHAGVTAEQGVQALCEFGGVKRRMEVIGQVQGITVYDDFAHHPTAIKSTLDGLRKQVGSARIVAVIEPRSNTMRLGVHKPHLAPAAEQADAVVWYQPPGLNWDLEPVVAASKVPARLAGDIDQLVAELTAAAQPGDHIVIMSNGGFGGIHQKLLGRLRERFA
ncbi:UDP-N-acetylmuramate:L-alanyl-gamma-D-glutamyl-meso-diaminopimelate ligase [Ketobacter sp.]|uniref:UDP-N-acetylmuramate:L-alanyl-gamma-D-glutamyl- meso-diaminopimelate ligase n=1 Tax=Ketobacter sp. TaxID=2083498 RepID=UPI000F1EAB21|nr:UDP-N-acetylmuramate:L-alanyl-gamma-D-glutamyl-meso-diaminopimelate ligase [Ketobacter sp.]RLT94759.1 MAG: UDP-N-acetylmuramate:L-alanyl-gamma-D-glutamyl-meso-diaminopimelate ligase [Ketobacter sp.]